MISELGYCTIHRLPPSPNRTIVTTVGPAIVGSAGNRWSINAAGQMVFNTTPLTNTSGVVEITTVAAANANVLPSTSTSTARAGSPGSYPAGWSEFGLGNLARSIIGSGIVNGLPYCDIRINGTASTTAMGIIFSPNTGGAASMALIAPVQYAVSAYVAAVGGTTTNIAFALSADGYTSAPAYSNGPISAAFTPTSTLSRYSASGTFTGTDAFAVPYVYMTFPLNLPIDVTLRIAGIQLEAGATPTAFVATPGPGVIWQKNSGNTWYSVVSVAGTTVTFSTGTTISPLAPPAAPVASGTAPIQAQNAGFVTLVGGAEFDSPNDVTNDISGGTVAPFYNYDDDGRAGMPSNGWSIANSLLTITAATDHGQGLQALAKRSAPISIGPVSVNGRKTNTGQGLMFRYAYFEARMRFTWQGGPGATFWTYAYSRGGAPNTVELDIVEVGTDSNVYSNWHGHQDAPGPDDYPYGGVPDWSVPNQNLNKSNSPPQFNTYGMLWTPSIVNWYYNNVLIQSHPTDTPTAWSTGNQEVGNNIDHLGLMGLSIILGTWSEPIDFEWVRIWQ